MTANIDTLLDWMRQRVEHNQATGAELTHAHLVTLLSYINELKDTIALLNNIITELSTPQPTRSATEQAALHSLSLIKGDILVNCYVLGKIINSVEDQTTVIIVHEGIPYHIKSVEWDDNCMIIKLHIRDANVS